MVCVWVPPCDSAADEEEFMGEAGLMEYQEREPDHLPLDEHSLQPPGMTIIYIALVWKELYIFFFAVILVGLC